MIMILVILSAWVGIMDMIAVFVMFMAIFTPIVISIGIIIVLLSSAVLVLVFVLVVVVVVVVVVSVAKLCCLSNIYKDIDINTTLKFRASEQHVLVKPIYKHASRCLSKARYHLSGPREGGPGACLTNDILNNFRRNSPYICVVNFSLTTEHIQAIISEWSP